MSYDFLSLLRPLNLESKELSGPSLSSLPISVPSTSALVFQGKNPPFQHTFVHYTFKGMVVLSCFSKQHTYDVLLVNFLLSAVLDRNSLIFNPEKESQPQPQIVMCEEEIECPFEYDPFLYKITKYRGRLYLVAAIYLAEQDLSDFQLKSLIRSFEDRCEEFHKEIQRESIQQVNVSLKVKDFLATTGFKNIKESITASGPQSLVIAMVEDEDMPLSTRTFPIRFEIAADMLTIRIFFSNNNAVASFHPAKFQILHYLCLEINLMLETSFFVFEATRGQIHLLTKLFTRGLTYEVLNKRISDGYLAILTTIKWTSAAFYYLLKYEDRALMHDPESVLLSGLREIMHRSPAAVSEKPVVIKMSQEYFDRCVEAAERSKETTVKFNRATLEVEIYKPRNLISIAELLLKNYEDSGFLISKVIQECKSQWKNGLFITPDMALLDKTTQQVTIIPAGPIQKNQEEASVQSYRVMRDMVGGLLEKREKFLEDESLVIDLFGLKEIERDLRGVISGMLHGVFVRLIPYGNPQSELLHLSAYISALSKIDYAVPILGLASYDNQCYIVHEFISSQSGLDVFQAIAFVDILQFMHNQGIAHGFISADTVEAQELRLRFAFPCIHGGFAELVNQLVGGLCIPIASPLEPFLIYKIKPEFEDLKEADRRAFEGLIRPLFTSDEWERLMAAVENAKRQGDEKTKWYKIVQQELHPKSR